MIFDSLKKMNFSPWYDFAIKGYLFVYGNTYNYPIFLTASGNAKVITYKQLLIDLVYINLPDLEIRGRLLFSRRMV